MLQLAGHGTREGTLIDTLQRYDLPHLLFTSLQQYDRRDPFCVTNCLSATRLRSRQSESRGFGLVVSQGIILQFAFAASVKREECRVQKSPNNQEVGAPSATLPSLDPK